MHEIIATITTNMDLFLDLDDTVYDTASLDKSTFQKPLSIFEEYYGSKSNILQLVVSDFWKIPLPEIQEKYKIPSRIIHAFRKQMSKCSFSLDINTFLDYQYLNRIECNKYLITTGFRNLQNAKIDALNIRDDFVSISIDDLSYGIKSTGKKRIFSEIIDRYSLNRENIFVIGDNLNSELLAGKKLGLTTVQRVGSTDNNNFNNSFVDHQICSFKDLQPLLKQYYFTTK